jgi:four helix bundle protein
MPVKRYSELIAWQKAMSMVGMVYKVTEGFPRKEMFGITNQIRRAAVSVPSNIAEGQGRGTTQDFLRFLCIARGSLQELETQLLIAHDLHYLCDEAKIALLDSTTEISRILNGLIRSLSA